jgi:hypothetical protein
MKKLMIGLFSGLVLWGQLAFADNHPGNESVPNGAVERSRECQICKGDYCRPQIERKWAPFEKLEEKLNSGGCRSGDLLAFRVSLMSEGLTRRLCDFDRPTHVAPGAGANDSFFYCSYLGYVREVIKIPRWKK